VKDHLYGRARRLYQPGPLVPAACEKCLAGQDTLVAVRHPRRGPARRLRRVSNLSVARGQHVLPKPTRSPSPKRASSRTFLPPDHAGAAAQVRRRDGAGCTRPLGFGRPRCRIAKACRRHGDRHRSTYESSITPGALARPPGQLLEAGLPGRVEEAHLPADGGRGPSRTSPALGQSVACLTYAAAGCHLRRHPAASSEDRLAVLFSSSRSPLLGSPLAPRATCSTSSAGGEAAAARCWTSPCPGACGGRRHRLARRPRAVRELGAGCGLSLRPKEWISMFMATRGSWMRCGCPVGKHRGCAEDVRAERPGGRSRSVLGGARGC